MSDSRRPLHSTWHAGQVLCANPTTLDSAALMCSTQNPARAKPLARLPALLDKYQKLDGRDYSVLQNLARTIREAGFIPTTKRGSGASLMSEREVVNLILGVNGSDTAMDAPEAVRRLRGLEPYEAEIPGFDYGIDKNGWQNPEAITEALHRLRASMWAPLIDLRLRFGDACEWLVHNAPAIDAEMTRLNLARIARDAAAGRKHYPEEDLEMLAGGLVIPERVAESAAQWRHKGTSFKLTIAYDEAAFEAIAPWADDFTSLRIRYSKGGDHEEWERSNRPRRAYVEIDFRILHELALLVAPKPLSDDGGEDD